MSGADLTSDLGVCIDARFCLTGQMELVSIAPVTEQQALEASVELCAHNSQTVRDSDS
jgi:hypothetical protein